MKHKMTLHALILFVAVTLLVTCAESATHPSLLNEDVLRKRYKQRFLAEFSHKRLQGLIQKMADVTYGKGFRYLGDDKDFYHGHVLYVRKSRKKRAEPVAILYHTQERAYYAHKYNPGSRYDYLDAGMRNWIQWLDFGRVEDANLYKRTDYRDINPGLVTRLLRGYEEHYTITDWMLDSKALGGETVATVQFLFMSTDLCKKSPVPAGCDDSFVINLPNGERVSLFFTKEDFIADVYGRGIRK